MRALVGLADPMGRRDPGVFRQPGFFRRDGAVGTDGKNDQRVLVVPGIRGKLPEFLRPEQRVSAGGQPGFLMRPYFRPVDYPVQDGGALGGGDFRRLAAERHNLKEHLKIPAVAERNHLHFACRCFFNCNIVLRAAVEVLQGAAGRVIPLPDDQAAELRAFLSGRQIQLGIHVRQGTENAVHKVSSCFTISAPFSGGACWPVRGPRPRFPP